MLSKSILLPEEARFHARPAKQIVEIAQKYESMICLSTDTQVADAKSVFSVMRLRQPTTGMMDVVTDGSDEHAAMSDIESVLLNMNWR